MTKLGTTKLLMTKRLCDKTLCDKGLLLQNIGMPKDPGLLHLATPPEPDPDSAVITQPAGQGDRRMLYSLLHRLATAWPHPATETDGGADGGVPAHQDVEVFGIGFHGQGDYLDGFATHFAAANNREELQSSLANVDAEVPLDIVFRISPEEEKAMARVSALPLGKEVRASHDGAEGEEGYGSIAEEEDSLVGIVLVVVVGFFVLVFVAKRAVSP